MEKQSFDLSENFFGGHTALFIKIFFAVIIVYFLILVLNFFRNKFIKTEGIEKTNNDMIDLLSILNKLFVLAGYGFIIGNIIHFLLSAVSHSDRNNGFMKLKDEWDYLTFGIILLFIGIGFKHGKESILKDRNAE
jgi:hypothetical protein